MKTLLILRHAKSSSKEPELSDHDRPLNRRGQHDAPRMGQLLSQMSLLPDLILCSTAARARATAESIIKISGFPGDIRYSPDFYLAAPSTWIDAIHQIGDEHDRIMIVGHNPGLETMVQQLTGHDEPFPTAALAQVELPIGSWQKLGWKTSGELVNIWRPKEL